MGEKLLLDPNDPFFDQDEVRVKGVAGSCYCCNQQIHIPFQNIDELPLADINKEHFYVFICDQCEEDIQVLNEAGVSNVSYDILWAIQESLENDLRYLDNQNGGITSIERDSLLINYYKETEIKYNASMDRYLDSLEEEESEEENDDYVIKRKGKKNS